jgi:4-amino-4-deoxy-L-arabinose transferase-like glycosyltransferase
LSRSKKTVLQAAVVLWSFYWTYTVGHLGIFAFDQSQVFDGGWRILSGQVPYKDFLMAFCPLAHATQAVFFRIFGVSWTSLVISAATVGALAAMTAMRIVRLLFGEHRVWLALGAGFLVGSSLQAMYGTLATEPFGFFFFLLSVWAVCEALGRAGAMRFVWFGLAGTLSGMTFLVKQNTGTLTMAAVGALVIAANLPRLRETAVAAACFTAGLAVAAGAFYGWLVAFSDPHAFYHFAIQVPAQIGQGRIFWRRLVFPPMALSAIPNTTQWCYAIALGVAFRAAALSVGDAEFRREALATPARRAALFLAAACPFVQSVFQMTTMNQYQNTLGISGLVLALGLGLYAILPQSESGKRQMYWLTAAGCITGAFLTWEILYYSYHRELHDSFPPHATVSRRLTTPGLSNVRWIQPTLTWFEERYQTVHQPQEEITPESVENLAAYLKSLHRDFFLVGDATYLYGVTGVVPPAPLLYYQERHYYVEPDFARIDGWVLGNLEKRDIRVIVLEKNKLANWRYFPFPRTREWMSSFRTGPRFGTFQVFLR